MELLIITGLVLLNGVFAMSEMALVSSRKFRLEAAVKKGKRGARTALRLSQNPTRFLSTVQIGITCIGILLGIYSGENLADDVAEIIAQTEALRPYARSIAVSILVIFITYLSIVLGELFPKRLGLTFPETIAMLAARPMQGLSRMTAPFVWLLSASNDLLVHLFGIKAVSHSKISEEEIKSIVRESAEGGEIDHIEQNIVERVFELGDRKVNSLMTHRSDLVFFDENDDLPAIRRKVATEKHSAYPVCVNNNIDDTLGMVLLKDLFEATAETGFHLKEYLKRPLYINDTMPAYQLLELFKKKRLHYAIVVDEYGTTQGMVTMDDVVDALVGDVSEQHEQEYQIVQRDDNSWFVDGQYPISEFLRYFRLHLDKPHEGRFLTVAGLLLAESNAIPQVGDKFTIGGYQLEVVDKDGQRIDKIIVNRL